jgi:DNA polymerase V
LVEFAYDFSQLSLLVRYLQCVYQNGDARTMLLPVVLGLIADAPLLALPLIYSGVQAGFPSPADDHVDARLDLNEHLIRHPAATFFVRAIGDSMIGAGIHSGDLLVVDRAIKATDGRVVIAVMDGECTVKRYRTNGPRSRPWLEAANPAFPDVQVLDGQELRVWGVVTSVVHAL